MKKEGPIICIYKIISPVGRTYIGSTRNLERRLREHSNTKGHRKLANSVGKYGWETHRVEILELCRICELQNAEIKHKVAFVEAYGWDLALFHKIDDKSHYVRTEPFRDLMKSIAIRNWNTKPAYGFTGKTHSSQSNEKRVVTRRLNGNPWHTVETKNKIAKTNREKVIPEETKQKISQTKTGKPLSPEHREALKKPKGPQEKFTCPHCNRAGGNAMKRWHFDNCKHK